MTFDLQLFIEEEIKYEQSYFNGKTDKRTRCKIFTECRRFYGSCQIYIGCRQKTWKNSDNEQSADFISCVAFGRSGEFAEKYLHQGTKIVVTGRIQTGSYTNKDGQRVYTTDVVVEEQEFAESKSAAASNGGDSSYAAYTHQDQNQARRLEMDLWLFLTER